MSEITIRANQGCAESHKQQLNAKAANINNVKISTESGCSSTAVALYRSRDFADAVSAGAENHAKLLIRSANQILELANRRANDDRKFAGTIGLIAAAGAILRTDALGLNG